MAMSGCIEKVAARLLSPHQRLSPFFFDDDGRMIEKIRLKLLERTQFIIDKAIGSIRGLEVEDIYLVGSSVFYIYHEKSDIDIVVKVSNKNCPYLHPDREGLMDFLKNISLRFFPAEMEFEGRGIDTMFDLDAADRFSNIYSLQNNCWVRHNGPEMLDSLTPEMLVKNYYQKVAEINRFMKSVPIENGRYSFENCDNIMAYFNIIVKEMRNQSLLDNYTYKLLRSQEKVQKLGNTAALSVWDNMNRRN